MPFDGIFLNKMIKELDELKNNRIQKIYMISKWDFLLLIGVKKTKLIASIHPDFYRIHISKYDYDTPKSPSNFTIILRKYLENGFINNIYQYENDRVIIFEINKTNEIGDKMKINLIFELMGRHSNVILVKDNIILDALKHISPFDNRERTIIPSSKYVFPDTKGKINPFSEFDLSIFNSSFEDSLNNKFLGASSSFINEVASNYPVKDNFFKCLNDYSPTLINNKVYYYFDLTHIDGVRKKYENLSEMLDEYYYELSRMDSVKHQSNNLLLHVNKLLDKYRNKLDKLEEEMKENNTDIDKIKGDLIYTYMYDIPKNSTSYECVNYTDNSSIKITLDPLISLKENANKYYSIYQKKKKALLHLPIQIEKTKDEIDYFEILITQIMYGTIEDINLIQEELESNKYLKTKKSNKKNNSSSSNKKKMNILKYNVDDSLILVGKNNLENSYLTHHYSSGSDMWFHVKDAPSSHVIVQGELTENVIRTAALIAAYYSKYRYSSSVPVDYTLIKYIKKIPGKRNCFVTYTNQKTIYIDPDISVINSLKRTV